jgi:hypothetical protein
MKADLALFLLFYNFNRGHGSLRKGNYFLPLIIEK